MKLKIIPTSKVYQQLFILILLLQNSVLGQIDWAEDDDDPGKTGAVFEFLFFWVLICRRIFFHSKAMKTFFISKISTQTVLEEKV